MNEGQKISELTPVETLYDGCCFPIVQNGETRKVLFKTIQELLHGNDGEKGDRGTSIRVSGEWIALNEYQNDEEFIDFVTWHGNTYGCKISHRSEPDITPENSDYWILLAAKGDTGEKGDSFVYDDFTPEQLESLKGPQGDKGDKGDTGEKGGTLSETDIFNICHPIGEVYVQFPEQLEPQTLYGRGTWEKLDYDGAFFRADGVDASPFGTGKQDEGLPNITGSINAIYCRDQIPSKTGAFKNSDRYQFPGTSFAGTDNAILAKFYASDGETTTGGSIRSTPIVYGKSDHVTPKNYTIQIWKRTA